MLEDVTSSSSGHGVVLSLMGVGVVVTVSKGAESVVVKSEPICLLSHEAETCVGHPVQVRVVVTSDMYS